MENSSKNTVDSAKLKKPSHAMKEAEKVKSDSTPASVSMLAVIAVAVMAVAKLVAGLLINSVALLSEGLHTLLDLFAAIMSYYTVRVSSIPADIDHRYGHGKIENAAGIAQAAFIFVPTLIIIYRAVHGLMNLETVLGEGGADTGTMVMGITMVINLLLGFRLLAVAKAYKSEAVRAAAYHQLNDLWTSVGVFIAMVLIWWKPEWKILDPLVALAVTVISIIMAWSLFKESLWNLTDKAPGTQVDEAIISVINSQNPVVRGYHNLRTRRAGNTVYADLHVEVCGEMSFREAHEITEKIESEIVAKLDGADVIIHADPCFEECGRCDINSEKEKIGSTPV